MNYITINACNDLYLFVSNHSSIYSLIAVDEEIPIIKSPSNSPPSNTLKILQLPHQSPQRQITSQSHLQLQQLQHKQVSNLLFLWKCVQRCYNPTCFMRCVRRVSLKHRIYARKFRRKWILREIFQRDPVCRRSSTTTLTLPNNRSGTSAM